MELTQAVWDTDLLCGWGASRDDVEVATSHLDRLAEHPLVAGWQHAGIYKQP